MCVGRIEGELKRVRLVILSNKTCIHETTMGYESGCIVKEAAEEKAMDEINQLTRFTPAAMVQNCSGKGTS